jgi:S-layer protein
MLTTSADMLTGTAGNDTFTANAAVVINPANGEQNLTATMQAVDVIDGGAGVDTLNLVATSDDLVILPTISNVEIISASNVETKAGTPGLTLNTTKVTGLTQLNVTKAVGFVSAEAAATTNIEVTVGTGGRGIEVAGGKDVKVTKTNLTSNTDSINVGAGLEADPVGAVTITATGAAAANANATVDMGAITVGGGKTISVTQKASSDASALVAAAGAVTHNQGDVTIAAGLTTTDVTIKQDANVAAVNGTVAVAGVVPVASVKFAAMANGATITIDGLTFTAAKALTAAEVATAFANLTKDFAPALGDTQGSGIVANGVYTGAFIGAWTSGAATGDTVVFTCTAAASAYAAATAPAITGTTPVGSTPAVHTSTLTTTGVNPVAAVAAKMGVTAGVVDITGATALKTVSIDGYDGTATATTNNIKGATNTALDTISLANGGGMTIASQAATLALNLEKVAGAIAFTAAPTTLNIKSTGNNTIGTLTAAATEALNVSGTGTLSAVTSSNLAATKAIKVTETAGLNLTGATLTALTSVDTTGTTGTVTLTIDSTKTSYAGGAGVDVVTFSNTTTATRALDLGAGNDTLVMAASSVVPTAVLKGGAGDDTLSLVAADAASLSAAPITAASAAAKIEGFERLQVTGATGTQNINLGNLGFTNHVTVAGVTTGVLTLTDLANNATVALTANVGTLLVPAGVTAVVKGAATGTADVLNLVLSNQHSLTGGVLTAANVETVNINMVDTQAAPQTKNVNTLTLAADKATSVTVTGAGDLWLTTTNSKLLTNIDGSAMTGALDVTSTNTTTATTIKGGAGNDRLIAADGTTADVLLGGAGNDELFANAGLTTMTGGAGNDLFVIDTASLNVNTYATITDFAAGDLLEMTDAVSFSSAKVTLGGTAVFQDFANAAINALATNGAGWFQFGGDTYVVADMPAGSALGAPADNPSAFVNGQDFIVKLTGLIDLSQASFNANSFTIALV